MINYAYQPSTDIAQTYDGTGAPGKRIQISRQPDQFNSEAPPVEDTQTTFYLTSTVLGGAAVVELNGPGSLDTVNIYAGGQRIARDILGNISFEHINPVTGSRVNSAGYSGYRGTSRTERDFFGAEIPTSNPYPSAQSYSDYKFGEQMYIEGGDPFDYSTGREIDGIPVSEAEFQRRVGNGDAVGDVFRGGRYVGSINFSRLISLSRITITFDVFQPPDELDQHPELWPSYYVGSFTDDVELNSGTPSIHNQQANATQKNLTQDDPKAISSQGSKNCQFTISFEPGTFYEGNTNLPNGPGEIRVNGNRFVGLGFTVSGTTRGGGGIGHIGGQVNPANPKGQWTLDQYTSNYSKQNGEFVTIDGRVQQGGEAWRDIDLSGYHFATDWTNRFSRYDHPSLRADIADTYKNQSFLLKVYRGKQTCQAGFHIIQRGNEIHWGTGAQGVWPK